MNILEYSGDRELRDILDLLSDFSDKLIDELSTDISNDEYIDSLKDMQSTLA